VFRKNLIVVVDFDGKKRLEDNKFGGLSASQFGLGLREYHLGY
jgi:hypothetical protein